MPTNTSPGRLSLKTAQPTHSKTHHKPSNQNTAPKSGKQQGEKQHPSGEEPRAYMEQVTGPLSAAQKQMALL